MQTSKEHQQKFSGFLELIDHAKTTKAIDRIVIHHPGVLGDNYEEIVTNLNLLSEAELPLSIVPPDQRG